MKISDRSFMPQQSIVFFGDSICVGQWIDISQTWVYKTSSTIQDEFPYLNISVHNRSLNGNTSRQALERMHFDCLSHSPRMIIIQFGLNDCNIWQTDAGHPRVSENAFRENILEMINRCRYHKVQHIVLNSNHPTTRTHSLLPNSSQTYEERNAFYNKILRLIGTELQDIVFFDINKIFEEKVSSSELEEYLLPDEIHLSLKGHNFYFENFYKVISPILKNF